MIKNSTWTVFVPLIVTTLLCGVSCGKSKEEKAEPEKEPGKPKIEAAQPEFDFGTVKQGMEVIHVFKLKNAGNEDLQIEKARGS